MSKRLCPQALTYDNIKSSLERHTSHEAGKQLLVNLMTAGDVDVTYAKLNLKCKLNGGRIEVPVRSVHCLPHLECFDLRHYLKCEAKNSSTIGAPTSTRRSQRPLWACPVCGERARADHLRVDDYFAHILASVPANVGEVQLFPDGSFEEVSGNGPEVTIDDEEPFQPELEQLQTKPPGPSRDVEELLKESKVFQGTLQDEKTFRTKKDLREAMHMYLEKERDTLSSLLKKLNGANQDDVVACCVAAKKLCVSDSRASHAEEPADANGSASSMEVVEVDQQLSDPNAPKFLSDHERDNAYRTILKRLKEDEDNVWPFLDPVPDDVEYYYDVIHSPICLAEIEEKAQQDVYHYELLFIADVMLMFTNCYKFNGHESPYYEMGYNLNKTFLELCKQHFPNSTLMPHLPEHKPNVKKP